MLDRQVGETGSLLLCCDTNLAVEICWDIKNWNVINVRLRVRVLFIGLNLFVPVLVGTVIFRTGNYSFVPHMNRIVDMYFHFSMYSKNERIDVFHMANLQPPLCLKKEKQQQKSVSLIPFKGSFPC